MAMSMFKDLPKDLVEDEILSHIPATYLKGLGSTCKWWNRLFNGDGKFARTHTEKAAKQFLVLILTKAFRICPTIFNLDGTVPPVEVKPELSLVDPLSSAQSDVCRVFHCDGLLLCTLQVQDKSRLVVWNPFTGETMWLKPSKLAPMEPNSALGYYQQGNNKSYKVLSYACLRRGCEIYEFSSDSWRILDDIVAPGWSIGYNWGSASLKGSTYFFAVEIKPHVNQCDSLDNCTCSLARFDFATEKLVPVPLPYQCDNIEITGLSAVKDEKLSVLLSQDGVRSKTEVWVTNKIDETTSQVVSWSKILALDLSRHLKIHLVPSFLFDEEKKVVMIYETLFKMEEEDENKSMIYIVGEDNKVTQVDLGMDFGIDTWLGLGRTPTILNYVPSLVQIERAGAKGKEVTSNM